MFRYIFFSLCLAFACVNTQTNSLQPARTTPANAVETQKNSLPALELIESFPVETTLDHPDIKDAKDVWIEMIQQASLSLDIAQFYISTEENSAFALVLDAVEEAADRGVRVRLLVEKKFYKTYPESIDALETHPGISVRRYDVASLMGGILHAKYFLVDEKEAYIGSQNFDWRSLTHIQELGLRIRQESLVKAFAEVFESDWQLAGGFLQSMPNTALTETFPVSATFQNQTILLTPVFSPKEWLPDPKLWDLPHLVRMIEEAKTKIRIQLLSYKATDYDGNPFSEIDEALRKAAARGVQVELLLADWSKRRGKIESLQKLARLEKVSVNLVTIPQWSGGFIPFARVVHSKYMVVDGKFSWIGTSNWEKGYFYESRNVGLVIEGEAFAAQLDRLFSELFQSTYSYPLNPDTVYEPPRIRE